MSQWSIILISISYLLVLFGVGYYAEFKSNRNKSIINNPYIYSFSLAVYCTAWTFFGSVGRATTTGIEYLSVYIGPTIMAPLFWIILRKIIRISKANRITSIADFISTRYGKNISLGIIVSLLCIVGIIPYIAIQLKAISSSIDIITGVNDNKTNSNLFTETTIYIAIDLSLFVILFGTRSADTTKKLEGMVAAIAFESIIKIVALTVGGFFITYYIFNGFADIYSQAEKVDSLKKMFVVSNSSMYVQMFSNVVLSMFALLFLPRQFQIAVVENTHENHLNKAMWLFPLYLFVINIFVLPTAIGGSLLFGNNSAVNADTFILQLPMKSHVNWLTALVYIGGFSAASSMIIVETIAISIMLSNNIVMPLLLSTSSFKEKLDNNIHKFIINSRRVGIVAIILLAYLYDKLVAEKFSLVSIGMVSFVAVAQFGPAIIGGIYWKRANRNAAVAAIIVGFIVWFFTLVIPSMASAGIINKSIVDNGFWRLNLLKPLSLFGLTGFDTITHGFFGSMFINTATFIAVSLFTERTSTEVLQAEMFVDVYKHSAMETSGSVAWKGTAYIPDLKTLLSNFIGYEQANKVLESYAAKHKIDLSASDKASADLVAFSERILAGTIGSASARIMVKSVVKEEELSIDEVLKILRESQMMKETNKELRRKSIELSNATEELRKANSQLKEIDEMKDEFLYTVTHELRTPLTSIRALSEIVYDNPDLPDEQRGHYLGAIIKETERLSHLITQVLNLEKYESGRASITPVALDFAELINETTDSAKPLIEEKSLKIEYKIQSFMPSYYGDKALLTQVFYNLLSNAIKYAKKKIEVSIAYENGSYLIAITDDGEGIAKDLHELIFDKFFQAKNQTLKKPEGSGLGLAICKKIIEMHNGKIYVESENGSGASFKIELVNKQ